MLDLIYHMTLLENALFGVNKSIFCDLLRNVKLDVNSEID